MMCIYNVCVICRIAFCLLSIDKGLTHHSRPHVTSPEKSPLPHLSPAHSIALWIDHCFISDQITQHCNWWFISPYTIRSSTERQHLIDSFTLIDLPECKINAVTVINFIPKTQVWKMWHSFILLNQVSRSKIPIWLIWWQVQSQSWVVAGLRNIRTSWTLCIPECLTKDLLISFHAWHHW